ncbi:MAG: hypothetical protein AAGB34_02110 [Planctomycetota bacterium]
MVTRTLKIGLFLGVATASHAAAGVVFTDWTSVSPTGATGSLDGNTVTVTGALTNPGITSESFTATAYANTNDNPFSGSGGFPGNTFTDHSRVDNAPSDNLGGLSVNAPPGFTGTTITVNFATSVTDPVMLIAGLDGSGPAVRSFTTDANNATFGEISGNFAVFGGNGLRTTLLPAVNGSGAVEIIGTFTELTFFVAFDFGTASTPDGLAFTFGAIPSPSALSFTPLAGAAMLRRRRK